MQAQICSLFLLLISGNLIEQARTSSSPASVKLFSRGSDKPFEVNGRQCRAGVFLLEPTEYHCACITGIWGFYTKYCKKPMLIIGGDKYCFKLGKVKISQVISFGNPRYPFEQSLSHFREDFKVMTKVFRTDDDTVEIDSMSAFLSVTNKPWTIKGNTGDKLCLNATSDERRVFCRFDLSQGIIEDWLEITDVQRGCYSSNVKNADFCDEIHAPNDEALCKKDDAKIPVPERNQTEKPGEQDSVVHPTNIPGTTDATTEIASTSEAPTSTELPPSTDSYCKTGVSLEDIRDYWNHPSQCPRSITELVLTDQLKRFAIHKLNKQIRTRQLSLEQTEELVEIQENLLKITCPAAAVPPEVITVLTEAFVLFLRDDFFYGVDETESSLYERIIFSLRTCLKRAKPFEFLGIMDDCNSSLILKEVVLEGQPMKIVIDVEQSWRNYELIIESGWKMFLNAHSYCYEDFLRQNDHHAYSIRMMQLFSNSIYEKWIQPLSTYALYKYIIPNANDLEAIMDNLDACVGALTFNIKCPVWISRSSSKNYSPSQPVERILDSSRKKRSIWINHIQTNREETEIWNGAAHCLQSPEDPSYRLGFGRCAHP